MNPASDPNDADSANRPLAVVACGVFQWHIRRFLDRHKGSPPIVRVLPAGLHARPRELRRRLQTEIDALSDSVRGIGLLYGVCGRGTVGLTARSAPLAVARVHDCIGAFLGGHERYLREFRKQPGTRYLTAGWLEAAETPSAADEKEPKSTSDDGSGLYASFGELKERYGEENARFICEFRDSWKRNYRRACYIRFPGEPEWPKGRLLMRDLARDLGWEHAVLEGDESLIDALLSGRWHDPRILIVPPNHKVVLSPGRAVLDTTAAWHADVEDALRTFEKETGKPVPAHPVRTGLGLGVDTGGTFTDAALYDFDYERVAASAKSPTTHEDLAVGIGKVLERLPGDLLRQVRRVGVSTTLATNAFVEGKRRPVALLLMTPFRVDLTEFPFRLVRKVRGALSMEGEELEPVDADEIRRVAGEARAAGCEAVAISGFAGVVDPRHERLAADIVRETTGLNTVCGHELSRDLDFRNRAVTAAMNAALIPLIERLLTSIERALHAAGIGDVPLLIVRGDGTQIAADVARRTPVETLLSGPAASAIGAARLAGVEDAVVADVGGTTLDIARVHEGRAVVSPMGVRVGGFHTCVHAIDGRTTGLGGDSEVDLSEWPEVRIGPRRIVPVCRLPLDFTGFQAPAAPILAEMVERRRYCLDFAALAPDASPDGHRILEALRAGPVLLDELARRCGRPSARFIPWETLETDGKLRRYGLTLTDLLHVQGRYEAFDRGAADALLGAWALLLDVDPEEIAAAVFHEFRRRVCEEIVGVVVPPDAPWDGCAPLRTWLTHRLAGVADAERAEERPAFLLRLGSPVIAVGAPAAALFPPMESVLGARVIVPPAAGVANAVGAICGDVLLRESAEIRITGDGTLLCSWRSGAARPKDLAAALDVCRRELTALLRRRAAENRCRWQEPAFETAVHQAQSRDGPVLFGLTVTAVLHA